MKHIEPIIMDTSFNRLGVIDDYISFIWTTRYYTVGDFELCVDVNDKNRDILKKDFYVLREDDDNVGIIEDIEITRNEDMREMVVISGRFLSSILARRIIAKQTQINTTVSNGVYALIANEIISPIDSARRIPNFLCAYSGFKERLEAQYTGKNLLEVIQDICETYGIGQKTTLTDINEFEFALYKGVDRSYNQTKNPYVVFSDEYDNLISSNYKESHGDQITDVLVAGEGEGLDRKTIWVSKENKTGLARYEAYRDQRNLSTNEGEITEAEYNAQMYEEGLESITNFTTAFEGEVDFENVEYKKDIFMGDICVIENTHWGVYINSRLVQIIESINENGEYTITPTFGV